MSDKFVLDGYGVNRKFVDTGMTDPYGKPIHAEVISFDGTPGGSTSPPGGAIRDEDGRVAMEWQDFPTYRLTRTWTYDGDREYRSDWVREDSVVQSMSAARYAIERGARDVHILVIGDSTGNDNSEWVRLFADFLATQHPTHSVSYRVWSSTDYASAVAVSTGSGARTIRIWNGSIAGSRPSHLMGEHWANAFGTPFASQAPDLVIWNHGHNLLGLTSEVLRGHFLGPMEQIRLAFPDSPHAMIAQAPDQTNDTYTQIATQIMRVCSDRGDTLLLDVYSKVLALGKPNSLYVDSIHPSAAGTQVYLGTVTAAWLNARVLPFKSLAPWLSVVGANLLLNGRFASFAGATPDNWIKSGNGVVSKETTIKVSTSAHSVKIVNGAAATFLWQAVSAVSLRGKQVTLAVLMRIDSGGTGPSGRARLYYDGSGALLVANDPGESGLNGFRWIVIPGVQMPTDATQLGAYLYSHSAGGQAGTVYIDRVSLVEGNIPRNA